MKKVDALLGCAAGCVSREAPAARSYFCDVAGLAVVVGLANKLKGIQLLCTRHIVFTKKSSVSFPFQWFLFCLFL